MAKKKYNNWKVEHDDDGIDWLHLDVPKSSANILNEQVIIELDSIVNELMNKVPTGVVILSDKESGFIAGADINEFTTFESEEAALINIQRAHTIFNNIENL
ncbi:MAG: crotonase, partial [Gammaproteobacteria bacterium]|nr:crotonase [Gammaproteobacteria bacterium]